MSEIYRRTENTYNYRFTRHINITAPLPSCCVSFTCLDSPGLCRTSTGPPPWRILHEGPTRRLSVRACGASSQNNKINGGVFIGVAMSSTSYVYATCRNLGLVFHFFRSRVPFHSSPSQPSGPHHGSGQCHELQWRPELHQCTSTPWLVRPFCLWWPRFLEDAWWPSAWN